MSEMSDMFKLVNAMKLAKTARVGMELTYFDVIELLGELESLKDYIDELEKALNIDTDLTIAGLRKELRDATARIAELEKDNDEFRQLIRDWSIVLEQDDHFQLWHIESARQAMLEINKEREE